MDCLPLMSFPYGEAKKADKNLQWENLININSDRKSETNSDARRVEQMMEYN